MGVDSRKLALVLAGATGVVLLAMIGVSVVTGATQEAHEHYLPSLVYTERLLERPGALRLLFGLDVAFLVLYTAFFVALADVLRAFGAPFVRLALGAMIATAMLDIVEDHHILSLLARAEGGQVIDHGAIQLQAVLSSCKFSVSYLSLVLFGLAIPRTSRLAWALAAFLTVGTLATAVADYAAPPAWRQALDGGRGFGFLLGFALAIAWLRTQRAPAPVQSPA